MIKCDLKDITIALPLATCDEYSISLIRYYLENFENPIVVIYRDGSPEDYIQDARVKYVKNLKEKNHPSIINQAWKEVDTEYICLNQWKCKIQQGALEFAIDKLKEGYGIVDLMPTLHSYVFSKHLISIIGFLDEWMTHNSDHEWDFILRLKHYDIAIYQTKKVKMISSRTTYGANRAHEAFPNYMKMSIKWKPQFDGFSMIIPQKNFKEKNIYSNIYEDREYLQFKNSKIMQKYLIDRCNLWNCGLDTSYINDDFLDDDEKELAAKIEHIDMDKSSKGSK